MKKLELWSGGELKALVDSGQISRPEIELISGVSTSTLFKIFRDERVRPKTRNKVLSAFGSVLNRSKVSA